MNNELKYRSILYSNYFTNQAGRGFTEKYKEKFKDEKRQFTKEIIPLLPGDKHVSMLDIGCGIGSLLAAMKEHNYSNIKEAGNLLQLFYPVGTANLEEINRHCFNNGVVLNHLHLKKNQP